MAEPSIFRNFRTDDGPAVRRIAFETAIEQSHLAEILSDPDFIADTLISGYAALEPDCFFVAEMDHHVVGYLTGCVDTDRFNRRYIFQFLPGLIVQFFSRGLHKKKEVWGSFLRAVWRSFLNSGRRKKAIKGYPSHCHINLLDSHRHFGLGAHLMDRFFEQLRIKRSSGAHLATSTEAGKNFFLKCGFETVLMLPSPDLTEKNPKELWIMVKKV